MKSIPSLIQKEFVELTKKPKHNCRAARILTNKTLFLPSLHVRPDEFSDQESSSSRVTGANSRFSRDTQNRLKSG